MTDRSLSSADHPSTSPLYTLGSSPSSAHDWTQSSTGGGLKVHGRHFIDGYNRVCNLRGVNMSGASKVPVNHDHERWLEQDSQRTVTFVGRPFPLEEAEEHLARLRRWGLTFVRFNITWEALEHAGPGEYDTDHLDYLHRLISLFPSYGIVAFLSMHQDVWSRFSGGSGAPAWTLELVGFDLTRLTETGAAYLGGVEVPGRKETDRGVWPTGYQKLAAATMATIFWAGDTFTPKLKVQRDGKDVSVQQFLQDAYLDCFDVLVRRVGSLAGVIGFQMMNEPHRGYTSIPALHEWDYNTDLHLHDFPSPLQSFALGAGHPTYVPRYVRTFPLPTRLNGHVLRNERGLSVWREDGPSKGVCVWEWHGVWGWDTQKEEAVPLRENYFMRHPQTDQPVEWYRDFYFPFTKRWAERVQRIAGSEKIVFLEAIPNEFCPPWPAEDQPRNFVYAPHWYDLNAMFKKAFGTMTVNVQGLSRGMFLLKALYWGHSGAKTNYALQLRNIVQAAYAGVGERPVVIGECGVPMDLNDAEAFRTGDFSWQARMMDALISGLDHARASFTLWNYNPLNDDEHGDYWNGENFSWYSKSQRQTFAKLSSLSQSNAALDDGGRILHTVVRPYPAKIAGIPLRYSYDADTGSFSLDFANPSEIMPSNCPVPLSHPLIRSRESEIFLPLGLTEGRQVHVRGVERWKHDPERQTLFIMHGNTSPGYVHRVQIHVSPPLQPTWRKGKQRPIRVPASIIILVLAVLASYLRLRYLAV